LHAVKSTILPAKDATSLRGSPRDMPTEIPGRLALLENRSAAIRDVVIASERNLAAHLAILHAALINREFSGSSRIRFPILLLRERDPHHA